MIFIFFSPNVLVFICERSVGYVVLSRIPYATRLRGQATTMGRVAVLCVW